MALPLGDAEADRARMAAIAASAGLEQHHKTNTGMNLNQAAD
jgi:hypothetical protein